MSNVQNFSSNFLYFLHSTNSIFLQIQMICTSIVHNFPLNFNDFVLSKKLNFSTYPGLFVHLMSIIFHWIFMVSYIQRIQVFLQIQTICTFNAHNFYWIFTIFVLSTISNFSTNQTFCTSNAHKFPLNFHSLVRSWNFYRVFMILYFERI